MKRKIAVATVSRAEYGILKKLLQVLQKKENVELQIIVTGSHTMSSAGMTINDIKNDGLHITSTIDMEIQGDQPNDISQAMGTIIKKASSTFETIKPDLLILISDRFETCAVALASLPFNIPIVHIAGGVITEGAIDDKLRHSITKMSHIHCVVDQEGVNNIIALGEEPWRIYHTGSMSIDLLETSAQKNKKKVEEEIGISLQEETMLFVYHPVTTEYKDTEKQITNVLNALPTDMNIIAFLPNQDTSREIIAEALKRKTKTSPHISLLTHVPRSTYASIMKHCTIIVGNSSSGLLEAPTFKKPVVNIGNRQRGRARTKNVIDCNYDTQNIKNAIKKARTKECTLALQNLINPFGDGNATERIAHIVTTIQLDKKLMDKKLVAHRKNLTTQNQLVH